MGLGFQLKYGVLTATARSTVLKTVGTASNRMGIGTSARRHVGLYHYIDLP